MMAADTFFLPPKIGCRKGVCVPAQIVREPFDHLEPACAVRTLKPARGHLADAPAEAMALHQQFDAVTEAALRFDRNFLDRTAREQPEAVACIMRWQAGNVIEREIGSADEKGLQPGAPLHASAGHEAAGANNVAACSRFLDHRVENAGVVVVIGGVDQTNGASLAANPVRAA